MGSASCCFATVLEGGAFIRNKDLGFGTKSRLTKNLPRLLNFDPQPTSDSQLHMSITMAAVQSLVERLDRPSAYYLGRVRWF